MKIEKKDGETVFKCGKLYESDAAKGEKGKAKEITDEPAIDKSKTNGEEKING